jgi:sporulation protein YlmC with PRC-barrel domain
MKRNDEMKSTLLAAVFVAFATQAIAQSPDGAFKLTQGANEWRIANYIGQPIVNASGEKIGDISDLLFDRGGKITTVVIGVGGFLGLGAKQVALPFEAVTYSEQNGQRQIMVPLTKEALQTAPDYTLTEKTTFDKVKERAGEVAEKASEKAGELKDQAVKKIEEYRKEDPNAPAPAPAPR